VGRKVTGERKTGKPRKSNIEVWKTKKTKYFEEYFSPAMCGNAKEVCGERRLSENPELYKEPKKTQMIHQKRKIRKPK